MQNTIGLPIIEVEKGKTLGKVKDFLHDAQFILHGILVDTKRLTVAPRWIRWDQLVAIGEDAVTVKQADSLEVWDDDEQLRPVFSGDEKWIGRPMITINGHQLGIVEDVYLGNHLERNIVGYELSDGFITDVMEGRKCLPAFEQFTFGEDAILVPVQSEGKLQTLQQFTKK